MICPYYMVVKARGDQICPKRGKKFIDGCPWYNDDLEYCEKVESEKRCNCYRGYFDGDMGRL